MLLPLLIACTAGSVKLPERPAGETGDLDTGAADTAETGEPGDSAETGEPAALDGGALADAMDIDRLLAHLDALQEAADADEGTRVVGSDGYETSALYVAGQLEAAGYAVTWQAFDHPVFDELSPPTLESAGTSWTEGEDFQTFTYSGSGEARGPIVAVDLLLPPGEEANSSTSGCQASDFIGFPAGSIALIQRGTWSLRVPAKFPMQQIGRKDASEADAPQETAEARTEEAGPVVTEAEMAPLRDALRGLLAEGLPAGTVDGTLSRLLGRLQVGVEQLRTNKQLAPWMHGVVCRVIEESGEPGPRPANLMAGDPGGQDRIAGALVPLLDLIEPEHAEVLRLTDHGTLTQRAAAARLGIPLVALKSRIHVARRKLRLVVLAGLKLLAPDTTDAAEPTSADTRAPRRRIPASSLLPGFTAGLEQLVRPWVPLDQARATAASVLTGLRAAQADLPNNGRIPHWLYATTRAVVLAGDTGTLISTLPSQPTAETRSILAPAMHALLADVDPDQRTALTLVDLEGRSQRDAARHVGVLPETFKQRLWRARRLGWQSLARALTASRQPAPAATYLTALLDALHALIQHLAPTISPNPALQRLLRQLHTHASTQRPSSSVVDFLYAAAVSSLQPAPRHALPPPPVEPGPVERASLADCLAPFLATLTPEQSEALTLIDLDSLSLNAAAERVGTDRPTFQGRLQRARIRLRQLLSGCLTVPPFTPAAA